MESTSIGLDIGASAVRAAEIGFGRDSRSLRRYGQVGLPPGAVVDGEVINLPVVTEALRRLWNEVGFTGRKVVLGVSGHRVIVRQADVPALNEEDLRSALRFDAQELIPIPMEEASFGFQILDRSATAEDGKSAMRILLVAAHRDLLRSHLAALKGAGLEAKAIDATPLALMRVVPPSPTGPEGTGRVEALVAIGAEITTVAVRQANQPKFIRSLAVGGAKLTTGLAHAMHIDPALAERLKRGAVPDMAPQLLQARGLVVGELGELAEEVRATIDFFVAQAEEKSVEALLVTGGASQTEGLVEALTGGTTAVVERIDPFAALNLKGCTLSDEDLQKAKATATTAVGLALWAADGSANHLNLLPEEVAAARRARRTVVLAGAGVAGMAALLGVSAFGQFLTVHKAHDQVHQAQQQVTALTGEVAQLHTKTAVHAQVLARADLEASALQGDIDWVRLLDQLSSVAPPGVSITNFSGDDALAGPSPSSSTSGSSVSTPVAGTVTFAVTGPGGLPVVAKWLAGLQRDPSLSGMWVSGISVTANGGTATFSSAGDLTKAAESTRAQEVTK